MKPVQPILILLLAMLVVLYFARLRTGLLDRILVVAFALLGTSMAAAPEWTNRLAHALGVDSGAHLFIYLAILGFAFFGLVLYSRIRDLQASLTELIRQLAIERAQAPPSAAAPSGAAPRPPAGPGE